MAPHAARTARLRLGPSRFVGVLPALWILSMVSPAMGQTPAPRVPNPQQRSGLLSRYTPVLPKLPVDADRDSFLGTRYQDEHDDSPWKLHPRNSWKDGGMYGRPLCNQCTAAVYPYFHGSPGGRIGPECKGHDPVTGRWITNFFNPFRPVGMYYDRGVYVPIYDTDYFVPGPGPFPWSHFFTRPTGG